MTAGIAPDFAALTSISLIINPRFSASEPHVRRRRSAGKRAILAAQGCLSTRRAAGCFGRSGAQLVAGAEHPGAEREQGQAGQDQDADAQSELAVGMADEAVANSL